MSEKKDITVAFTGHRTYCGEAEKSLQELLQKLYEQRFRRFLTGMAWGFDLAAGEAVMRMKEQYDNVELIAVVPFADFHKRFNAVDLERYNTIMESADEVIIVNDEYSKAVYRRRNDFLVDNSSFVVAWWNYQPKGGTAYTIKRAIKQRHQIVNLCPSLDAELF